MGQSKRTKQNTETLNNNVQSNAQGKKPSQKKTDARTVLAQIFQKRWLVIFAAFVGICHFLICQLKYFFEMDAIQDVEIYFCIALGIYYLAYLLVNKPQIRFRPETGILIILMVWFFISCYAMETSYNQPWIEANERTLIDTGIALLAFFPLGTFIGKAIAGDKNSVTIRCLKIILSVLLFVWTAFIVFVLYHIFQLHVLRTPGGGQIGMTRKAALNLSCYYNTTGAWQMLFVMACFCMMIWMKHPVMKVLYGLSTLINLVALYLSNSRTALVATVVGCAGIMFVLIYKLAIGQEVSNLKNIRIKPLLAALGGAIVLGALLFVGRTITYQIFQSITHFNEIMASQSGSSSGADDTMIREVFNSTTATLTGRTDIWAGALKGMVSSVQRFFLGVTPVGVNSLISLMTDGKYDMYTHNQFLEVGVALGVPAMCAFIVWFVLILKAGYVQLKKEFNYSMLLVVFVLALMLGNMAEATLMFYQFITGHAFFFLCGWIYGCMGYDEKPIANRQQRRRKR